jgi:hypothetical protein
MTTHNRRLLHRGLATIAAALAVRLLVECFLYFNHLHHVLRYQLETAATQFVVVVAVCCLVKPSAAMPEPTRRQLSWLCLPLAVAIAYLLFWPSLTIGFLSDDFVIADQAARWGLGAINSEAFRPLPVVIWSVILHAGGTATAIHALNVGLHGVNGLLTAKIAEAFFLDRRSAALAGAFVLVSPLAVEPVAWCSGVFDVAATTTILAAVLLARRYASAPSRLLPTMAGMSAAALLSKETGGVLLPLVWLDCWIRRRPVRQVATVTVPVFVVTACYGLYRYSRSTVHSYGVTKYVLQRFAFGDFGGFAVPWHLAVIDEAVLIPVVYAGIIVAGLLAAAIVVDRADRHTRAIWGGAIWIVIATAPAVSFLFVGNDLQGSRYLYPATLGWALILVGSIGSIEELTRSRLVSGGLVLVLVALSVFGVSRHMRHWLTARDLRNEVLHAAGSNPLFRRCEAVALTGLPDSKDGAYIFRNGANEAFQATLGIKVVGDPRDGCRFVWRPDGVFATAR